MASFSLAGGFYSEALRDTELYDIGLEFDDSSRPQISRASYNKSLRLTVRSFKASPASGGNTQDSSSNYPVVQLRSIDSNRSHSFRSIHARLVESSFTSYDREISLSARAW